MDNPTFIDEEDIPMVHQDEEDYDDNYSTPDTSRAETSFIELDTQEKATLTLRLKQKVKRDKIIALYKHLNVTGNPGLADMDQFIIKKKKKPKTGNTDLLFLDGKNQWQSVTNKRTSEFLSAKTIKKNLVD